MKRINVDYLRNEVNKCDKKYGVRLKTPEMWRDPEKFFGILSAKADMNLAALLCCLNGINPEDYFGENDIPNQDISLENKSFLEDSVIDWNSTKALPVDSIEFRIKFTTLTLSRLIGNMGKIALNFTIIHENEKHSLYEHAIINLVKISKMCSRFIKIMITNSCHKNIMLLMNEYVMYTTDKKGSSMKDLQSCLNGHVIHLRESIKVDPLTHKRFATEDLNIYMILKIAYMLTTGKTNLKALPGFEYIENATLEFNMEKLIAALGHAIIENKKIKKLSPMFHCYLQSNPKVMTDFYEETEYNYYLRMGILALSYTSFVINDEYIEKFIKKMIKKKGKQ